MIYGSCKRTFIAGPFLVAAAALMSVKAFPSAAQAVKWRRFHDPQTGLSFRYPPDMHVRLRDPGKFGMPNMETIVDLMGNTKMNPDTIVLKFLVRRGRVSSGERAKRRKELNRCCVNTSPIIIDGHKALVCLMKGSAAIHWSVKTLDPRECTILTLLGGADANQATPPPHDGEFPLLSIIRTVRFTPSSRPPVH